MHGNDDGDRDKTFGKIWGQIALFAFGAAILLCLSMFDRKDWAQLRPASGSAAAMGHAADSSDT